MKVSRDFLIPLTGEYPPYFDAYYAQLPEGDVFDILEGQSEVLRELLGSLDLEQQLFRYAEGKWSVREVAGHINDAERIFGYRALRLLRGDSTPLPGYDQDAFVANAGFDGRSMESLLMEFENLRCSILLALKGYPPEAYLQEGMASGHRITVRAIVKVLAAHVAHHIAVLHERYLS